MYAAPTSESEENNNENKKEELSALKIQKVFKGHKARHVYGNLKAQNDEKKHAMEEKKRKEEDQKRAEGFTIYYFVY